MKFNKLTLSNIGSYYGNNEFDLTTSPPHQNVILIGGKNGAGKTTILNAITLGLFGPLKFGFQTENESYKKKIYDFLNRRALKNKEKFYQIKLGFTRVENYERSDYEIIRRWELKDNKVRETVQILKDKQYLNKKELGLFLLNLREEIPPHVIDLCFFDGEDISRIILEDRLAEYIEKSSRALFNLDLFEYLEKDLNQLISQDLKNNNYEEINRQFLSLNEKLQKQQNEHDTLRFNIENSDLEIKNTRIRIEQVKNDFKIYGGLFQEERSRITYRIHEIELLRKQNSEKIKSFMATSLPFYMNRDLLGQVQNQMECEQANETYTRFNEMLDKVNLKPLSEEVKPFVTNKADSEVVINNVIKGLMQQINPRLNDVIHRASFKQRSKIENKLNQIKEVNIKDYLSLFEENKTLLAESKELRNQLALNDESSEFKDVLASIEQLSSQLEKLKQQKEKLEEQMINLTHQIEKTEIEVKQVKKQINETQKHNRVNKISNKLITISERFRDLQLQKKLQQVEREATIMINKLLRKKEFLSAVEIDVNTFNVILYNKNAEELNKDTLSAGERQLLLISIIWAIMKVSGRRLPLVFDTLLGRLDKTHKESLLKLFIPSCGEQVIILSTDSEIDSKNYSLIKSHLASEYTIEYNTFKENVDIKKEYFDFDIQEANG
ncbi:DNA sulfur modification protein DndD [Priestia megaterium]|uniref:DNA sulfur modification protein DndD n=1 Tax=Priestia megaterium TaxID=1404 RepID=UPI003D196191